MDLGDLKYLDAPAKVLKLSAAARIGAKKHPQLTGTLSWMSQGCTCFYGAAAVGRGWKGPMGISVFISDDEMDRSGEAYQKRYDANPHREIKDGTLTREQMADRFEAIGY